MSLPNSYLITNGRIEAYFDAILNAEAPERFSYKFIENLGFTSSNDRLLIGVLKEMGFLDTDGIPQERYYQYLDRTQSSKVLADGIRYAYSDLFTVNVNAHQMDSDEVANKLRTLYSGSKTEAIIGRIAKTFEALCSIADFSKPVSDKRKVVTPAKDEGKLNNTSVDPMSKPATEKIGIDTLQYHINIVLPESRDQAVYDAIFKALREHLR